MNEFKCARNKLGWSQQKLADQLEIPLFTYKKWETGVRIPPPYVKKLVLKEIRQLTEISINLNGFKELLDKYDIHDPKQEEKLRELLFELKARDIDVEKLTFYEFYKEEHTNYSVDVCIALSNTINTLEEMLENVKSGNPPTL